MHPRLTPARLLAGLALTLGAVAAPAHAAPPTLTPSVVGEDPSGNAVFRFPQAVAFSPGGSTIYVGSQFDSQVYAFNRDGSYKFAVSFHATRAEPGRIGVVGGVATDHSGHLYVLDAENDRVQIFNQSDGSYVTSFGDASMFKLLGGNPDTGSGGIAASGLTVLQATAADAPVVYVADQGNDRVTKVTLDPGTLKLTGAPFNSDPSLGLGNPQGLALSPDGGKLYVADDDNNRVLVLDAGSLGLIAQVGSSGSAAGQFKNPYDVAVDNHNQLYVADNLNNRVDVFDATTLASLATFGRTAYGPGVGNFEIVRGVGAVADDPSGGAIVADTANDRVQLLDPTGVVTGAFGIPGRGPGYVTRPRGADFAPDGSIGVADQLDSRIERFDADGTYQGQLGNLSPSTGYTTDGANPGQFSRPYDVAFDGSGNAWVADTSNDRIQEISPQAGVLFTSPAGAYSAPRSVAAGPLGSVYVADTGDGTVHQILPGGADATIASGLASPSAVAYDGRDVYVADSTHVRDITTSTDIAPPSGETAWDHPAGLAVAADGTVYVSERGLDSPDAARIVRGTPNPGTSSRRTGTSGSSGSTGSTGSSGPTGTDAAYTWDTLAAEGPGPGQVIDPTNLSLSQTGTTLLVADTYNNRLLRFDAPGAAPAAPQRISVSIDQPARGTVVSDKPGIACVTDCQQSYGGGRTVVLTETPTTGSQFNGWGGSCAPAGTAATCTLATGTVQAVSASFIATPVAVAPPPPPPPAPAVKVTSAKLSRKVLRLAHKANRRRHVKARKATKVRVTVLLSRPATLTVGVQQAEKGRRQGSACVKPTKANRKRKACTRYVTLPRFETIGSATTTRVFSLSPVFKGKALKAGKYRLSITAVDSDGNRVGPKTVTFTVAR